MTKKACKNCKRILNGNMCEVCKSNELTTSFQGKIVIFDVNSEIAKKLEIITPGTYAIKV